MAFGNPMIRIAQSGFNPRESGALCIGQRTVNPLAKEDDAVEGAVLGRQAAAM
jgi:hypothetical protein